MGMSHFATHHKKMVSVSLRLQRRKPHSGKFRCYLSTNFVLTLQGVLPQNRALSTREKTTEQKAREAKALKEVESVLAEKRRLMTQNNNTAKKIADTPKPAELLKGESRNIVAKKVGLKSGHEVDRSIKAINTIDELTEKGIGVLRTPHTKC